ncbi:hypothetical protein QAD02_002424 [Eretmocerus hayati]|uniref:Uncharacterized protein n=1 Tax=Eretmocerus hayati TaxID=131215 RepID=A0ACC2NJ16_9HYME|nr:hypothetical protein QAD02_002424 [Eretmocerus hayati]
MMMSKEHNVTNHHKTKEGAVVPYCSNELSQNEYSRIIYKSAVYHSTIYKRPQVTDDTYVKLSDGTIAQIIYFYLTNEECHARVKVLGVTQVNVNGAALPHIFLVTDQDAGTKDISITLFEKKIIHLDVLNDLEYVCLPLDVFDAQ